MLPESLGPQLQKYWTRPVSELVTVDEPKPGVEDQERHRIYSLMLMALVHEYWNGNKNGRSGTYPLNEPDLVSGAHLEDDYRGHNIAAIAVNGDGAILDFDFNHNRLFNSSAEHAEARLVRRVFAMSQLSDTWGPTVEDHPTRHVALDDYTTLAEVTIYTSLESCAQCAGVMALGHVRQVVYLQTDPGMYYIGRILRNLTQPDLRAPLPIEGRDIGMPYFEQLDAAAKQFGVDVATTPFFEGRRNGAPHRDAKPSLTSFLCTKRARDIYTQARREFEDLNAADLTYGEHRPNDRDGVLIATAKTNAQVVHEAKDFLAYAIRSGRRGTPHH